MDVDAGVVAHVEEPSTPRTAPSNVVDNCKANKKPVVGMIFDTLKDAENFYKSYAYDAGFSVRVGAHKKDNEEIFYQRYLCSREGYRKESVQEVSDQSGKKRKTPNVMETRCGCQARIVVKLDSEKKYQILSFVEEHNHGFVSPDKRHLLRSNRQVSERAKSTLFNCHKARWATRMVPGPIMTP
jgi:hypothetical protein